MNYENKNVVVTGSTGGMGLLLCERLAAMGANLSLCSNNEAELKKQAQELKDKYSVNIYSQTLDISDENAVSSFFKNANEQLGNFSALANLVGLSIPSKISDTDMEVYDTIMNVNVKGTFLAGKYFSHYAESPAIIVNIGSTAAKSANPNAPLYCTAKAAVNMLSQGMLLQMGSKDIRVTTINPGGTDTPFWGDRPVDKTKLMIAEDVVDIIMFALTSSPRVQIHDIYFESSSRF